MYIFVLLLGLARGSIVLRCVGNQYAECEKQVLYLQPMISPKRFDIFPPDWEMFRRSTSVQIFLQPVISPN